MTGPESPAVSLLGAGLRWQHRAISSKGDDR